MTMAASRSPSARDGICPAMIASPTLSQRSGPAQIARPHRVTIDKCLVERRGIQVGDARPRPARNRAASISGHETGGNARTCSSTAIKCLVDGQHGIDSMRF